jgi:hypothetical protein
VRVEIVGGAAVELVALAEFAAYEKTKSNGTESGGDPANRFDESGLLILFFVKLFVASFIMFEAREWERGSGGDFLGCSVFGPRLGTEDHVLNDSAGS